MFTNVRGSIGSSRNDDETVMCEDQEVVKDPVEQLKEEIRARKELRRLEAKAMSAQ